MSKRTNGWIAALAMLLTVGAGFWTVSVAGRRAPAYVVSTDSDGYSIVPAPDGDDDCIATIGQGVAFRSCGGDGAYLGVELEEEIDHPEGGARVTDVVEDSPADRAGLQRDDIIIAFDGHTIRGPGALTHRLHDLEPGANVTLEVIRDGRSQSLDVELGKRSDAWRTITVPRLAPLASGPRAFAMACDDGEDCHPLRFNGASRPRLGVQITETTPELRRHLGGSDDAGVLVSKVLSGTAAEDAGVQVGDLIVAVEGEEVANHWTLQEALARQEGTFELEVVRDGVPVTLQVRFPESDDRPTGPTA